MMVKKIMKEEVMMRCKYRPGRERRVDAAPATCSMRGKRKRFRKSELQFERKRDLLCFGWVGKFTKEGR